MSATTTIEPATAEDLATALSDLRAEGRAVEISGGGSVLGRPPASDAPLLSVAGLRGIVAHAADDLTVTVRAGTPLTDLASELAAVGQECPIEPAEVLGSTVGGRIATALAGPRQLGAGRVRDWVLRARFVTGDGKQATAGGVTVKDVTGYDLCRLVTGSWGTIAVLTEVTLKLRPIPRHRAWYVTEAPRHDLDRVLFRPAGLFTDADRSWVLLEGHPDDAAEQAALVGLTPADAAPELPERMRPARRVRLRDLRRPYRVPVVPGERGDAFVFRGCIMDHMFRDVHQAVADVAAAIGYTPRFDPAPPCCGALHIHAGREEEAHRLAGGTIAAFAGTSGPIVVDSAGCGAAMKEYGEWLGTPEAHAFSERVIDFAELLTPEEVAAQARPLPLRLAYQAPCHLKNVQRLGDAPLELLRAIPGLEIVEPDDAHLCCGSGGIYSIEQPEFGDALLAKKSASPRRTAADGVISGNPGCSMQIARAGWQMHHPAELLARALRP